ncbi:Uma2 family endonuclease [Actinospica sp. MGRD01-02]|uniref:Uma2 family endonuclease n=1 Tax=Actinospica acidithermotolerans TaxID=2828514 RepID=A0A941IH40_9ACTN|nr:Uma2 family endonuclease [Actinospica acidithermotolerans]MBR7826799.1 Uma2 family endonuclease [Actinospica acidithermotolerans]
MSLAPVPEWMFPPEGGFTAEDLDHLPDLPPHTELIDGSLVLVSPQAAFHALVLFVMEHALHHAAPPHLRVRREMTITLDDDQRPEPDLLVIHANAARNLPQTTFVPSDVVLAAEVVSPESRSRDRKRKPMLYAEAGIEHFWLIENERGKPVLYTHQINDSSDGYDQTGRHEGIARLGEPFPVEIDFGEIDRL